MSNWDEIKQPVNILLMSTITGLYIFDRHDEEEVKYLKIYLFITGFVGIINVYKYSKLGHMIDDMLETKFFEKHQIYTE